MQKVLIQDRLQNAESLAGTLNRARTLGRYTVYFRDPNLINSALAKYGEVTPADIQRVARQYFGPTQRTVVLTNPKEQPQAGPARPQQSPAQ